MFCCPRQHADPIPIEGPEMDFTGEIIEAGTSASNSVEGYAARIKQGWHKVTATVLEVAALCKEASDNLSPTDRKRLIKLMGVKPGKFSKLVTIGGDVRL